MGAYIGAAYWFTSSTGFANPAVTLGRAFTDTFAGINPTSVPAFLAAQLLGGVIGLAIAMVFYPISARTSAEILGSVSVTTPSNDRAYQEATGA